jgi:hypothetical protein
MMRMSQLETGNTCRARGQGETMPVVWMVSALALPCCEFLVLGRVTERKPDSFQ